MSGTRPAPAGPGSAGAGACGSPPALPVLRHRIKIPALTRYLPRWLAACDLTESLSWYYLIDDDSSDSYRFLQIYIVPEGQGAAGNWGSNRISEFSWDSQVNGYTLGEVQLPVCPPPLAHPQAFGQDGPSMESLPYPEDIAQAPLRLARKARFQGPAPGWQRRLFYFLPALGGLFPPRYPRSRSRTRAGRLGRGALKLLGLAVLFHVLFLGNITLQCLVYKVMNPALSSLMLRRQIEAILGDPQQLGLPKDFHTRPIVFLPLKEIGKGTRRAFLTLEDQHFYEHHGISPGAIREAMERNRALGRTVFGGSTISQQTAKNLFLYPSRSYFRKYLEILATLTMEGILGKDRILELYLNTIEFGPGVYGLGQASFYHFGVSYRQLPLTSVYPLAALITSPLRWNLKTMVRNPGMQARLRALLGQGQSQVAQAAGPHQPTPTPTPTPTAPVPPAGVETLEPGLSAPVDTGHTPGPGGEE